MEAGGHWSYNTPTAPQSRKSPATSKSTLPDQKQFSNYHDVYLTNLQEKNKHLQKLKQKDKYQLELEDRERGFSLYLNGANLKSTQLPMKSRATTAMSQKRRSKTADSSKDKPRVLETPRQEWGGQGSVEVKTSEGELLHITAAPPTDEFDGWWSNEGTEEEDTVYQCTAPNPHHWMYGPNEMTSDCFDEDSIEEESEGEGNEEDCPILTFDSQPSFITSQRELLSAKRRTETTNGTEATRSLSAVSRKQTPPSSSCSIDSLSEAIVEAMVSENESLWKDGEDNAQFRSQTVVVHPTVPHIENSPPHFNKSRQVSASQCSILSSTEFDSTSLPELTIQPKKDKPIPSDMQNAISLLSENVHKITNEQQLQLLKIIKQGALDTPLNVHSPSLARTKPERGERDKSIASQHSVQARNSDEEEEGKSSLFLSRPFSEKMGSKGNGYISSSSSSLPSWLISSKAGSTKKPSSSPSPKDYSLLPSPPSSRVQSGRRTGLRTVHQLKESCDLRSSSETALPTFLDDTHPRLNTAFISQGRREIKVESQTYLVPSACETLTIESVDTKDPSPSLPPLCSSVPSHAVPVQSHGLCSPNLPSLDLRESLESIQKFEHHKWDNLKGREDNETFVAEYKSSQGATYGSHHLTLVDGLEPVLPDLAWSFPLPELPQGTQMVIKILSTWGDRYFVGLTGVEIFTDTGEEAPIERISAFPPDINILPEYSNDPRIVTNLIDGFDQTRDDLHMWLAPFQPYSNHVIQIAFSTVQALSMIRIWNYNKSRIHSYRGVKDIQILLDGKSIFEGEIRRASGGVEGGIELFAETIVFTDDEDILASVASHDRNYPLNDTNCNSENKEERPLTGDTCITSLLDSSPQDREELPSTSIGIVPPSSDCQLSSPLSFDDEDEEQRKTTGTCVLLTLLSSWGGSSNEVGLNHITLLDSALQPIPLSLTNIRVPPSANTKGLQQLIGFDNNTTKALSDGIHLGWYTAVPSEGDVPIEISLDCTHSFVGLRVWNYNGSSEDCDKGAKFMTVHVDGKLVSPVEGFLLRKGPGNNHYDFGQLIKLKVNCHFQLNQSSTFPSGFVYKMQLLSTWGDPYYIGLTGLELLGKDGSSIKLTHSNIAAHPSSVNVLEGVINDVRTADKLVDCVNSSDDSRHMWLAPILPGVINTVYLVFDSPKIVSGVRLWNYGKTPSRGVKEFTVLVDDLLVYTGTLPIASLPSSGILPTITPPLRPYTFQFTENVQDFGTYEVQHLRDSVVISDKTPVNETTSGASKTFCQGLHPFTAVTSKLKWT